MTIVAYSGLHQRIAADSYSTTDQLFCASISKIVRTPEGGVAGACGEAQEIAAFLDEAGRGNGMKFRSKSDDFEGILVLPSGEVWLVEPRGSYRAEAPHHVCGSGSMLALGAFHMGATPEQAVEAACAHSTSCRGPILSMELQLVIPPKRSRRAPRG
jgi:hypothetical protein